MTVAGHDLLATGSRDRTARLWDLATDDLRHGPEAVADAFVSSRLAGDWGVAYGTLPTGVDTAAIIAPATASRTPALMASRVFMASIHSSEVFRSQPGDTPCGAHACGNRGTIVGIKRRAVREADSALAPSSR